MLSVNDALDVIRTAAFPLGAETVFVGDALGRVLAAPVVSGIDQPPFRASAMDGYAVRRADAREGARLRLIGVAAAGAPFRGAVGAGEAVRIFTGAVAPDGADHIVIQEEATEVDGSILIAAAQTGGSNIRAAGIDFAAGSILKKQGARLSAIDLGLIASANISSVLAYRRPMVACFDNGDELVEPGAALADGQIIGSNRFALEALIGSWGAAPRYLGRAADQRSDVRRKFEDRGDADVIVAIGGASVGDHDHVQGAFADAGGAVLFSKIAVRPGKPTWFGRLGETLVLGLPGNPASAIVCAILFLRPLIARLAGEEAEDSAIRAALTAPLKPNGARETYLRGRVTVDQTGRLNAEPYSKEDSSLLTPLSAGNCLIRRGANAPEAAAGDLVDCILYGALSAGGAA